MYAAVAEFWLDGDWESQPVTITIPSMSLLGVGA